MSDKFNTAKTKFGSVTMPMGVEVALTQTAWVENYGEHGGVRYNAHGIDENGCVYRVTWDTTPEFDAALDRTIHSYSVGVEPDDRDLALVQDESTACDWATPAVCIRVDDYDDCVSSHRTGLKTTVATHRTGLPPEPNVSQEVMNEAKEIYENAESRVFNSHTREYMARKGDKGTVIPEGEDGEPDFDKGVVTPLSMWPVQDF